MRLGLLLALTGCRKVPLSDVEAGFDIADVSWFEAEETLFVFWEVEAEQGLGDPSVIEITYATDTERVDWTPVTDFEMVHTHREVDCGLDALCGSASIHVPLEPREVALRLRYHYDGELALNPYTVFNVVAAGDPHHRSMVVYGVFDETNRWVQWRGRHQFPTIRNEGAERLGLRRYFQVDEQRSGTLDIASELNPYGYGRSCPDTFTPVEVGSVTTLQRAVFNDTALPLSSSEDAMVCGAATVTDATGPFVVDAWARKNPEVRPAFPLLRSPVEEVTRIDFFIAPCERVIDQDHLEMQRQRLLMEDAPPTFCADDWESDTWVDELVVALTDAIEDTRPDGDDMVVVIGLHRDEAGLALAVEDALAQVIPEERDRSSPRVAGAWVFDSTPRVVGDELASTVLWCPARLSETASGRTCAVQPDQPDFELGPFTFGNLPIFPDREDYLEFLDTYSKRQAGSVKTISLTAPRFATTTEHVDLGAFGSITFLNDESIYADARDAFSYCPVAEPLSVFVRSELLSNPDIYQYFAEDCASGALDATFCDALSAGVLPLSSLPAWHDAVAEGRYDLGVFWDFPFLMRAEYETFFSGAVSAFAFSVPFGIAVDGESYQGSYVWLSDTFDIEDELAHCTRFCSHPTFDSAGVYSVLDDFRTAYASSCYRPVYPVTTDGGFPSDP